MSGRKRRQQTLIATLGSEPQVVTLVLDRLLDQDHAIDEVVVVYTAAQAVQTACDGLDNAAIARRLHKSERTVANQLTRIYAKLGEWLRFPEQPPDRSVLIAEFAPYLLHQGTPPE